MANFKQVNAAVSRAFPDLDIEVVRGEGYVYFAGEDGFDAVRSLMTHPVSTPTDVLINSCVAQIGIDTAANGWKD